MAACLAGIPPQFTQIGNPFGIPYLPSLGYPPGGRGRNARVFSIACCDLWETVDWGNTYWLMWGEILIG